MGTTLEEGQAAVADCIQRDGKACEESWVLDSIPPHDVTVDGFQIEEYEVSVLQYVTFLNYLLQQSPGTRPHLTGCNGPCALTVAEDPASDIEFDQDQNQYVVRLAGVDRSLYPVKLVTWFGADAYCRALDRYLPTEAQWERAARGPANTVYPWGPQWDPARANTSVPGQGGTLPVNSYSAGTSSGASGFSVFNTAGNVAEWTNDWYQSNFYTQAEAVLPNPRGPATGSAKVVRGGSWTNPPLMARAVHRIDAWEPGETSTWVGFRCADDASPFTSTAPGTTGTTGVAGSVQPTPFTLPSLTPSPQSPGLPTATLAAQQ
jgi:formylglycine-generating enzyme required for sulfatase activity